MRKFLLLFILSVLLPCLCMTAGGEISCQCGRSQCQCFIQLGDEGPAVKSIHQALVAQGYLAPGAHDDAYDARTVDAVCRFQRDHDLPESGVMDDATLTWLLCGDSPDALDAATSAWDGEAVWIPTDGGRKSHAEVNCRPTLFIIENPRLISRRNAEVLGFDPCKLCHPEITPTDLSYYK